MTPHPTGWRRLAARLAAGAAAASAVLATAPAAAALDANGFGAQVCRLFPGGGGGHVTAFRGHGCSWGFANGRALGSSEKIVLTADRRADADRLAMYRQHMETFMNTMRVVPSVTVTPYNRCEGGNGAGRMMVMAMDPAFTTVTGYMVCGSHFVSADITLKNGGGSPDPAQLFIDLMPQVVPLLDQ